jgi:hypothetical protein
MLARSDNRSKGLLVLVNALNSRARFAPSWMRTIWDFVEVDVNFADWDGKFARACRKRRTVALHHWGDAPDGDSHHRGG